MSDITDLLTLGVGTGVLLYLLRPIDDDPGPGPTPDGGIYLSDNEIDAIKAKINAGRQPWSDAYDDLMSRADDFLSQGIRSIGGDFNTGDSEHYFAAMDACHLVRDCGIAYRLSGQTSYANKARDQINAWCVDPDTRMIPRYRWVQDDNGTINITITIPGLLYGASLLTNYSGWSSSDKSTFMQWCRDFLNDQGWRAYGTCEDSDDPSQNYDSWQVAFHMALAAITDNQSSVNSAVSKFKTFLVPCHQDTNGSFYRERDRDLNGRDMAIFYSLWNTKAWLLIAEAARHRGIDLYSFKLGDGRGIEKALDFHARYAVSSSGWPYSHAGSPCWDSSGNERGGNGDCYELAYRWKQKTSYKSAINACGGRPRYDTRIMGPITLTHGV